MTKWIPVAALCASLVATACGGSSQAGPGGTTQGTSEGTSESKAENAHPQEVFGPLEVGADWKSYTKVNTEAVPSEDHGGRFVDTYVNDVGLEAYKNPETPMPVGSIVVKTSWEVAEGKPTDTPGPTFVMEKKDAGYDDENENWYYAIHWENPPPKMRDKFGQIYWRSPSPKVEYCFDCHNGFDRQLGMVPEGKRAW